MFAKQLLAFERIGEVFLEVAKAHSFSLTIARCSTVHSCVFSATIPHSLFLSAYDWLGIALNLCVLSLRLSLLFCNCCFSFLFIFSLLYLSLLFLVVVAVVVVFSPPESTSGGPCFSVCVCRRPEISFSSSCCYCFYQRDKRTTRSLFVFVEFMQRVSLICVY